MKSSRMEVRGRGEKREGEEGKEVAIRIMDEP